MRVSDAIKMGCDRFASPPCFRGAGGENRTRTSLRKRILSPARLPVHHTGESPILRHVACFQQLCRALVLLLIRIDLAHSIRCICHACGRHAAGRRRGKRVAYIFAKAMGFRNYGCESVSI